MDSTVMSELGMTIQSILPGEDPERATTYGQCAETYPFMHIIREYDPKTETVFGLSIDGSLRSMTKHWRQEWVNQAKRTLCGHCMSLIRHFNWDPKNFNLTDEQIKHADNRRPVEKQPRLKRANEDPKESEKIKRPRTPSLEPVPIQEIIMKKEAIGLAPPRSEEQEEEWIAPHHRPCPSFNMPSQSSYSHVEPGILHYPSGIVFGPTSESTSETEPQVPKVHPQGLTSDQVAQQMAELAERMGVSPRPVIPFPASPGYQDDQPPADPSEISQRPPVPVVRLPGTLKYQEGQPPADPAEFMETSPVPVVRLPGTLKYQEGQPPADPAEFMESSQDIAVRLPGSTSEQETQRTGEEHLVEDDGEQAVQSQSDGRRKGKGRNEEGRGKEVGDSSGAQGKSGRSGEKKEKKNKKKGGVGKRW
ncbi:hypothetical protein N7450_004175 [Penicillium hetheringtonii]|uniref:Uncharacterized protein n=1 Tax=Penicillium hetheringtonii TaxID=911720 RepID=A0AAD6GU60_9EURO|nr:hypothetical protein N7450_004175 [Penicillium hetheringtonii]